MWPASPGRRPSIRSWGCTSSTTWPRTIARACASTSAMCWPDRRRMQVSWNSRSSSTGPAAASMQLRARGSQRGTSGTAARHVHSRPGQGRRRRAAERNRAALSARPEGGTNGLVGDGLRRMHTHVVGRGSRPFRSAVASWRRPGRWTDHEWRSRRHPADRRLADHYRDVADRQDSFEAEYRVVRPDGTVAWLSGRGRLGARPTGAPGGSSASWPT